MRILTRSGSYIDADFAMGTNLGASFGPRIVTSTFRSGQTKLVVDVEAESFQDEWGARRRAARIAVPFGLRTARLIADGKFVSERQRARRPGLKTIVFEIEELDGHLRRQFVRKLETCIGGRDAERDGMLRSAVADGARRLAEDLHGAIDLSVNAPVFGGG